MAGPRGLEDDPWVLRTTTPQPHRLQMRQSGWSTQQALFVRHVLEKLRTPFSTILELILPVVILLLFGLMGSNFETYRMRDYSASDPIYDTCLLGTYGFSLDINKYDKANRNMASFQDLAPRVTLNQTEVMCSGVLMDYFNVRVDEQDVVVPYFISHPTGVTRPLHPLEGQPLVATTSTSTANTSDVHTEEADIVEQKRKFDGRLVVAGCGDSDCPFERFLDDQLRMIFGDVNATFPFIVGSSEMTTYRRPSGRDFLMTDEQCTQQYGDECRTGFIQLQFRDFGNRTHPVKVRMDVPSRYAPQKGIRFKNDFMSPLYESDTIPDLHRIQIRVNDHPPLLSTMALNSLMMAFAAYQSGMTFNYPSTPGIVDGVFTPAEKYVIKRLRGDTAMLHKTVMAYIKEDELNSVDVNAICVICHKENRSVVFTEEKDHALCLHFKEFLQLTYEEKTVQAWKAIISQISTEKMICSHHPTVFTAFMTLFNDATQLKGIEQLTAIDALRLTTLINNYTYSSHNLALIESIVHKIVQSANSAARAVSVVELLFRFLLDPTALLGDLEPLVHALKDRLGIDVHSQHSADVVRRVVGWLRDWADKVAENEDDEEKGPSQPTAHRQRLTAGLEEMVEEAYGIRQVIDDHIEKPRMPMSIVLQHCLTGYILRRWDRATLAKAAMLHVPQPTTSTPDGPRNPFETTFWTNPSGVGNAATTIEQRRRLQAETAWSNSTRDKGGEGRTIMPITSVFPREYAFPSVSGWFNDLAMQLANSELSGAVWMAVFCIPAMKITKGIAMDRELRVQNLLRVLGVSQSQYWISWFVFYGLWMTFFAMITAGAAVYPYRYPNFFALFVSAWLTGINCISLSIFVANTVRSASHAPHVAVIICLVGTLVAGLGTNTIPHTFGWAFYLIATLLFSANATWLMKVYSGLNIFTVGSDPHGPAMGMLDMTYMNLTVVRLWCTLMGSCVLWTVLGIYIANVRPLDGSIAKRWYFPVSRSYWASKCGRAGTKLQDVSAADLDNPGAPLESANDQFGEENTESTTGQRPTAAVRGVKKRFKVKGSWEWAVRDVSLSLFPGEIYVLLGENGAGKSTIISMMIGALQPSGGYITIGDNDVVCDTAAARRNLGYCSQFDILYGDLTVREHFKLVAKIKGVAKQDMQRQVEYTAHVLELTEKLDAMTQTLSGGQKRRVSVGMALIGNSSLLLLDEPSTGMDPNTRRSLWVTIRRLRAAGHSILLTTHFMDEADVLADRVGILQSGVMCCEGSPLSLKAMMDIGHNLVLVLKPSADANVVTQRLVESCPDLFCNHVYAQEMTFTVPSTSDPSKALQILEDEGNLLGVDSFSISGATLESVFIRVSGREMLLKEPSPLDEQNSLIVEDAAGESLSPDWTDEKSPQLDGDDDRYDTFYEYAQLVMEDPPSRFRCFLIQLSVLLWKENILFVRNWKMSLFQLISPVCVILLAAVVIMVFDQLLMPGEVSLTSVDSHSYRNIGPTYNIYTSADFSCSKELMDSPDFKYVLVPSEEIKNAKSADAFLRENVNLVPGEVPAIMLLMREGFMHNTQIYTYAYPLARNIWHACKFGYSMMPQISYLPLVPSFILHLMTNVMQSFSVMNIAIGISFIPGCWARTIVKEKIEGSKRAQHIGGASLAAYWATKLLQDFVTYWLSIGIMVLVMFLLSIGLVTDLRLVPGFMLFAILFFVAAAPFAYAIAMKLDRPASALILLFIIGWVSTLVVQIVKLSLPNIWDSWMRYLVYIIPHAAFSDGLITLSREKRFYDTAADPIVDPQFCRDQLTVLGVESVVYAIVLFAMEHFSLHPRSTGVDVSPVATCDEDLDVLQERYDIVHQYGYGFEETSRPESRTGVIRSCFRKAEDGEEEFNDLEEDKEEAVSTDNVEDALVIQGLRKVYALYKYQCIPMGYKVAVNDLWFRVGFNQCFAFLGVNGAGKSTTVSMLTSLIAPTRGTALFDGQRLGQTKKHTIGLCPQVDALIHGLTVREHLFLYGRIACIPRPYVKTFIGEVLDNLKLQKYADLQVQMLSGGNQRKLSLGLAFIGDPKVVFLDEPSSGVDPVSRRHMWSFIKRATRGRAVVLTSHVLEECEALAHRIGIMKNGALACIGSASHLKASKGRVWMVEVSVHLQSKGELLLAALVDEFPSCRVLEVVGVRHRLTINKDDARVSSILGFLHQEKERLGVANFAVSDVTLETIFVELNEGVN